jgi:hypothetical protein
MLVRNQRLILAKQPIVDSGAVGGRHEANEFARAVLLSAAGEIGDNACCHGSVDGGADCGRMMDLRGLDWASENVGQDLHNQWATLGNAARKEDPIDWCSACGESLCDRARAETKGFNEGAVDVGRRRIQCQADEQPAQQGVRDGRARTIPPIEREQRRMAERLVTELFVEARETLLDRSARSKHAHEPMEHVAERRLSGLVAPQTGDDAVASDALDSRREGTRFVVEQQIGRRRAERADKHSSLRRADGRGHHMRINGGDRDHRLSQNAALVAPSLRENPRWTTDGDRRAQLWQKARRRVPGITVLKGILRFVRGEVGATYLMSGQSPDEPIPCFNEARGPRPHLGSFLRQLRGLGQQPFAGYLPPKFLR